jgi:hypothetical protein
MSKISEQIREAAISNDLWDFGDPHARAKKAALRFWLWSDGDSCSLYDYRVFLLLVAEALE